MPVNVATAQSPVSGGPSQSGKAIRLLMREAREAGADLIHFAEGAMSGHAKSPIKSWDQVDWDELRNELSTTAALVN